VKAVLEPLPRYHIQIWWTNDLGIEFIEIIGRAPVWVIEVDGLALVSARMRGRGGRRVYNDWRWRSLVTRIGRKLTLPPVFSFCVHIPFPI
jgi:hypothetical protein